ncbi:hypothetical protein PBRA_008465 [Plasmodiophora brassicae]|uniref:Snurportin-1 n=1 Tax=Plasmodiophora brassicae TaxID=37360 RepID=A0A0G4J0M9_PLABS|nr:hypothetical protein PBRA_008465 [Plasmodiophora brassicae]
MVSVPGDLHPSWSVAPRPEGQRCLGRWAASVLALAPDGRPLFGGQAFTCAAPGGSPATASVDQLTILDCILQGARLYIVDLLAWKGYDLVNATRQFRHYWMVTKADEMHMSSASSPAHAYAVCVLPSAPCTRQAVWQAYHGAGLLQDAPVQDGLLFHHVDALYEPGYTPLTLVWKDARCSTHEVDSFDAGDVAHQQPHLVVLRCTADGRLQTADGVDLGDGAALERNRLHRFTIGGVDINAEAPTLLHCEYAGACSPAKRLAHSWSKIVFQSTVRNNQRLVTIETIVAGLPDQ